MDSQKYRVDGNGGLWVKKMHCHRLQSVSTLLPDREYEYPCMDMDGDAFYLLAFIGGWFGLHKFITGHWLIGTLYVLTGGCAGVYYICDLIALVFGNYADVKLSFEEDAAGHITRRNALFFNRPIRHKAVALCGLPIAAGIAFLAIKLLYIPLLSFVCGGMFNRTADEAVASWVMAFLK